MYVHIRVYTSAYVQHICTYICANTYISLYLYQYKHVHTSAYMHHTYISLHSNRNLMPAFPALCLHIMALSDGRMVWYCGRYCHMGRCPIADNQRPTTVTTWHITCALATDWSLHLTPPMNCKLVSHPFCWFCALCVIRVGHVW